MESVERGYIAGEASVWAQPNGPNTEPMYLGCHGFGDLEDPGGDLNLAYCPDPGAVRGFRVSGAWQDAPGVPSATIITPVGKTADYLEHWPCPGNIILNKSDCGRRDQFTNRSRAFVLYRAYRTGRTYQGLAARTPDDETESLLEAAFSMEDIFYIYALTSARQSVTETEALAAIARLNEARCASDCGPAREGCDVLVAVAAAGTGATAHVLYTLTGGAPWSTMATDPFAADEDLVAVQVFSVGPDTTRVLVARGTDASNPAEVAYTDDWGATWTLVEVGETNGQYVAGPNALFAIDQYHIWATTDDGYVYFSNDGGATWTAQEEGTITAAAIRAIRMISARVGYFVGETNEIALTEDGGASWTPLTGPAGKSAVDIWAVAVLSARQAWIGYEDGTLYYTEDRGVTWTQRTFSGSGAGAIVGLDFVSPMVGWMAFNPSSGNVRVYRTIDGGYTWEAETLSTSSALAAMIACDDNTALVVAAADGGTGYVGKVFAAQ